MEIKFIITGIILGLMSGLFGIGGSIVATPILKIAFNLPDLIALASPLPVTIPTALSGTYNYWKKGLIRNDIAKLTIAGGLPFTVLGALGTKIIAGKWLMLLTGIFVIIVGLRLLKTQKPLIEPQKACFNPAASALLLGIITGVFSGLLAIGGGVILVPAYLLIFGLTMQEAAATSLVCVAFFAIPGTIVHWMLGNIDWNLVLNLSIGVIPAGFIGSKIAISVKSKSLELAFSIFLILFGIYFILKQLILF